MDSEGFSGSYITLWTREAGWQTLVGSATVANVTLSSGGTLMSNGIYPGSNPAYLWPGTWLGATNEFNPIPPDPPYVPCGSSRMSFYDMGGNGDYAVGLTWAGCAAARGFLWDKATNTSINLGSPNTRSTRANAVTANGEKVIGWGTALWGGRRGASWQNGTWTAFGDPNFLEPKACITTAKGCTSNSADPVFGCPEYVTTAPARTPARGPAPRVSASAASTRSRPAPARPSAAARVPAGRTTACAARRTSTAPTRRSASPTPTGPTSSGRARRSTPPPTAATRSAGTSTTAPSGTAATG